MKKLSALFVLLTISLTSFASYGSTPCSHWVIEYHTATGSLDDLIKNMKVQSSMQGASLKFSKIGKYRFVATYNPTDSLNESSDRAKVSSILNQIQDAGYSVICEDTESPTR